MSTTSSQFHSHSKFTIHICKRVYYKSLPNISSNPLVSKCLCHSSISTLWTVCITLVVCWPAQVIRWELTPNCFNHEKGFTWHLFNTPQQKRYLITVNTIKEKCYQPQFLASFTIKSIKLKINTTFRLVYLSVKMLRVLFPNFCLY